MDRRFFVNKARRDHSHVPSGFTLVELVVTLVIIGALAAVSAPIFFSADAFKQRGFYREVQASLRYAQKHAIAAGCSVQIRIASNSLFLERPSTPANCSAGPYDQMVADPSNPGSPSGFRRDAPSGVTLSPAGSFTFAASGAASGDVTVTVGGQAILVAGMTGYVR